MANPHVLIFGMICFIIGIICYFCGCNPEYSAQCYNYNVINGVSKGYDVDKETCNRCVVHNKDGACTAYEYYDCWDTDIKFNYGNNQTCYYNIVSNSKSESYAYSKGENYPIGKKKKLLKESNSSKCMSLKKGMDIWISGITFLSLTGLCMVIIGIECAWNYFDEKKFFRVGTNSNSNTNSARTFELV